MIDLDVHTHLIPVNAERLTGIPGVRWLPEEQAMVIDGHRVGIKSLFQPQKLIDWMDRRGVQRALVSVPPPTYRQDLPPSDSLAWVNYLNEELLAIASASNGRLGALYYLPLEHPGLIEPLLESFDARFEGIALAAGGHPDIVYSEAHYQPLWQWLEARKSFVFMHPGACGDARLAPFYLENLVGNPYETGVAAAHLVMAGIPSRYPGIRFCLAHAGGVFPMLCGRMEQGFTTSRPGVDLEQERPLQAARRFWADCIAHHPGALRLAREVMGEDKVVFGSDWPFPMGIDDPSGVR
jgi:aminocarboxymuconate-semialdehyde decarboxylase